VELSVPSRRPNLVTLIIAIATVWLLALAARAEDKPSAIRVANPGVGIGGRPVVAYGAWSLLHIKGILEEEFKPDGIPVTWTFARGAGPAVNELFANGLADITLLGDLPSIIGRSSGLKTRLLAAAGLNNIYIAVPYDSPIKSVKDLAGKRLSVLKGTCNHLSLNRILASQGMAESQVRTINMDNVTSLAALTTKDIDAALGGNDLLSLRDRGAARIIYSTKGDPRFTCNSSLIVSDEFAKKYPSIVKRIVRQYVKIAKWVTDQEANPSPVFQLFTKSGIPFSAFKDDWGGESYKVKVSPLVDPYLRARYSNSIQDAHKFKLIRQPFDVQQWIDTSFIDQVVKEEGLESYWPPRPALQ